MCMVKGSYLPLCQEVLGCWLLWQSLFVGGIYQDVACCLSLSQPVEELVQVEVELMLELQSCLQSRLSVRDAGVTFGRNYRSNLSHIRFSTRTTKTLSTPVHEELWLK